MNLVTMSDQLRQFFWTWLLIAGLSSSSVGTMAGDVVMQGFINVRINLYLRRAITMLPALAIIISGVQSNRCLVMVKVISFIWNCFALSTTDHVYK